MKKLLKAAVVAVASISLVAGTAVSAEAAKKAHVNVVKLGAPSITVASKKCRTVKAKIKVTGNSPYWDAQTKVTKGGKKASADSPVFFIGVFKGGRTEKLKVCPAKIGLGKVTLGPTRIHAVLQAESIRGQKTRTDRTKGHFYIRGKAKVALSGARDGKSIKLTATAKRYKPTGSHPGYKPFNRTVKFQAKTAHGWKTVKTKKLAHGTGTTTLKHGDKRAYRVTFGKISTATGATSKAVKL